MTWEGALSGIGRALVRCGSEPVARDDARSRVEWLVEIGRDGTERWEDLEARLRYSNGATHGRAFVRVCWRREDMPLFHPGSIIVEHRSRAGRIPVVTLQKPYSLQGGEEGERSLELWCGFPLTRGFE